MTTAITGYWAIKDRKEDVSQGNIEELKLREDVEKLVILLSNSLTSTESFEVAAEGLINEVFKLRIDVLKWRNNTGDKTDTFDIIDAWIQEIVHIREEKFDELKQYIFYGIRMMKRVHRKLGKDEPNKIDLDSIDFYQFIQASLLLEIDLIAADIIIKNSQQLRFSDKKIAEVARVALKNAKSYKAAAVSLGIIENKIVWDNSNSKATQEQIDELAREVNKAWWQKNKDKIMKDGDNC